MNNPVISFIIPVFNAEQYLVECIESILNQTIHKEIILIDDGSKDKSLNIALDYSYKYEFITVIHYSKNRGQSLARNNGIQLARGKYIYFVDSDDLLLEVDLNEICSLAEQNQVDLVKLQAQFQVEMENRKSEIASIKCNPLNLQRRQGILLSGYDYFVQVARCWIPGICWTIIRREFLLENNILFKENVKAEDQLFYVQLLTCKPDIKLLDIGDIIYHYRIRKNSTITSYDPKYFVNHFEICVLLEKWNIHNNFNTEISESIYLIMARIYQTALGLYNQFSNEDKQKYAAYISPGLCDFVDRYLG